MRKLTYNFFLLIVLIFLGSCGETKEQAEINDSAVLKIAVLPTAECLPFYYADSMGIFDTLGVEVKLVTFNAAMDADTAFVNGDVDGIVSDLVKACLWEYLDSAYSIVMGGDVNLSLVTALNARISKPKSLKEKVIGITRHSVLDFATDKLLEVNGFVSTDLNKPQINNIKLRMAMVDQNQYDGALLPEPYASEAVARGGKRIVKSADVNIPGMMTVLFCDSVAMVRAEEIEKVIKAYNIATDALNADTLNSQLEFIPDASKLLPDTLYSPTLFHRSSLPSDSMKQVVREWLKGRDLIKK